MNQCGLPHSYQEEGLDERSPGSCLVDGLSKHWSRESTGEQSNEKVKHIWQVENLARELEKLQENALYENHDTYTAKTELFYCED